MTTNHEMSKADIGDRHQRLMAIGMLAIGVMYATTAAEHVFGAGPFFDWTVIGLAVTGVGLVGWVMIWKFRRLPTGERHLYFSPEGYVADTVRRAHAASWGVTFIFVAFLEVFADRLETLPAEFFLELTAAVMLGVFSCVFLWLNRAPGADELEEAPRA